MPRCARSPRDGRWHPPAAAGPSPRSDRIRSVSWLPGWSEFTVTPSPAISRASVFRKPVSPARAVLDRIRVGIGWRTATDVIASTRPQCCACIAGTDLGAHRDRRQAVLLERGRGSARSRCDAKVPGGGPPPFATRMSTPPSASRAARTNSSAPPRWRRRPPAGPRPGCRPPPPRPGPGRGCRCATCAPSAARAARGGLAQALRRRRHRRPPPADPQVHGPLLLAVE